MCGEVGWLEFSLRARYRVMASVPVVPVRLDSLWGSIFSFCGGRFLWKLPRRLPYPVTVTFGWLLPSKRVNSKETRDAIEDLGEKSFQARPELKGHIGDACFRALARSPGRIVLVDRTAHRRELSAGKLLAVAAVLSRRWRNSIGRRRVGIVFPPGMGGFIANLAVVLSGKSPVNLNFTMGESAIRACLRKAEIETVISAAAVRKKMPHFPWPEDTRDMVAELKSLSKLAVIRRLAAIWLLPAGLHSRWFGLPREGDGEEAALLFSSGSTGEPKGVVLSHRNIIGNCLQIEMTRLLPKTETLLGCLPIFHSFGFTVTLWFPVLTGLRVVTVPSPLEHKRIASAVSEEQATVLLGTPTFYRPYFRRVERKFLQTVKYVVAGAEKTPDGFAEKWEDHFGNQYLEGYGLTETAPVVSVNLPGKYRVAGPYEGEEASRRGSVGRLLPGMAARIVHAETGEELNKGEAGILQLRGPNVFSGYLNDPVKTSESLRDGWYTTGDLARIDEDGFLFIEGRRSRFSKIGGEMVPHGTVEQDILKVFDLEESEKPVVAVTGMRDPAKGETLVLVSAANITAAQLRERLNEAGLPNLWVPRKIVEVEEIPCLLSGKLDLKAIEKLAQD